MRKFVFIIPLFLIATKLPAQDCTNYVYMQKGKTIEATTFNAKGDVMRKSVSFVADVTTTNGTTVATVTAEGFDKNGRSHGKRTVSYKCNGGTFMMDMSSNMPEANDAKISTTYIEYPAGMKVGDHFKDVDVTLSMTIGGKAMTNDSKITDRTVVAKESVTTPAGTWDCFKITYNTTVTVTGYNAGPQTIATTEWYAPNFGIVKFQLFGMTTEITSIK